MRSGNERDFAVVNDVHEGTGQARRIGALDDLAAANESGRALPDECLRPVEQRLIAPLPVGPDEDGNAAGTFHHTMPDAEIAGRVGLDEIRAEVAGLPDEREDFFQITAGHAAIVLRGGKKFAHLDHQRHGKALTRGSQAGDVLHALVGERVLAGDADEARDDARGIEPHGLLDGVAERAAEKCGRQHGAVDIGDIGAQEEGRFGLAGVREIGPLTRA